MTNTEITKKPRVLIPYLNQWDVADHTQEWQKLSKEVSLIKYKIEDVRVFEQFLQGSEIDCLWVTDDFVEHLGGPAAFWDFYPSSLKAVVVPWVGCDFIDGRRLRKEKNIILCNIGPNASNCVADMAMFLVISCFRLTSFWEHCFRFFTNGSVPDTRRYIGGEGKTTFGIKALPSDGSISSALHSSYELPKAAHPDEIATLNLSKNFSIGGKSVDSPADKNALILGFGSIGRTIGKRLSAGLGMNIHYFKRSGPIPECNLGYNAKFWHDINAPETWAIADIIIISLPKDPSTDNIINEKTLKMCKDGVRIVNVGRGSCIDEDALIKALDSGKVTSCGLDVFKNESTAIRQDLLSRWDVTLLPHIGSTVSDMMISQTLITLENIKSILLNGKEGVYPIN